MMETCLLISSAENVCNNPDLLTRILVKVPVKPLLTFKCVSKQWLSLISDPYFCFSHTHSLQTNGFLNPKALLLKWIYETSFDTIPLKQNSRVPSFSGLDYAPINFSELPYHNFFTAFAAKPELNVLQSCYGLFLCTAVKKKPANAIPRYFICNPTTKKFKELSFPENDSVFYVCMAFDPLKSPHYKVIRVRKMVDDQPSNQVLDVYSSETDSWSISRISFHASNNIVFDDAVFCNGKIHWNCSSDENSSLYFDVEKESVEPWFMPISTVERPRERRYIGESRGVLYISVTYLGPFVSHPELDVFEMASDCSHWTLKHRLNIEDIPRNFPDIRWDLHRSSLSFRSIAPGFSDICITQFEKDDEPKVVIWMENVLIFFDFSDGAWKKLNNLAHFATDDPWGDSHYWEFPSTTQSLHALQIFENLSSV